jgi:hypothetical protein
VKNRLAVRIATAVIGSWNTVNKNRLLHNF